MLGMMKLMAALVLQHERNLQHLSCQDSFVFYAQVSPQGAVPVLTQLGSRVEGPAQTESGCGETPNNEDVSPEGSHQRGPSESAEDGIQQTGRRSVGQSSPNWCASEGRGPGPIRNGVTRRNG